MKIKIKIKLNVFSLTFISWLLSSQTNGNFVTSDGITLTTDNSVASVEI